ncbi:hypothetical protein DSECCO2_634190 [anaerobic digester metagenome]
MISGQDMFLVLDQTLAIKIVMQNPAFGALAPTLQGQNYDFGLAILIHILSSYIHIAESSKHSLSVYELPETINHQQMPIAIVQSVVAKLCVFEGYGSQHKFPMPVPVKIVKDRAAQTDRSPNKPFQFT